MRDYRDPLLFEFARDVARWRSGALLQGIERDLAALSPRRALLFADHYRDAFVPLVRSYGGDASLWALEQREHHAEAALNSTNEDEFRRINRRYWLFRDTRKGQHGGSYALERLGSASDALCDLAPEYAEAIRAALVAATLHASTRCPSAPHASVDARGSHATAPSLRSSTQRQRSLSLLTGAACWRTNSATVA